MTELEDVAVIFDLDGTLIDTAGDLAASMNDVLAKNGREILDPSEVRGMVGRGARAILREGFARTGAPAEEADLDAYVASFLDHYMANIAVTSRPFEGAVEAMDGLCKAGARLAICTNKREGPAVTLINKLGLADYFDVIVGSDTTTAAKPDPTPVQLCLEKTNCTQGVFIGDSDTDIKAALAANMPCLLHRQGYGPTEMAGSAFAVFDCYKDLFNLVSRSRTAI